MGTSSWREFGRAEDLDVDFHTSRAAVVSTVLALCQANSLTPADERQALAWQLTLGGRIGALATIVAATFAETHAEVVVRCPADDCQEPFEFALPLDGVRDLAEAAQRQPRIEVTLDEHPPVLVRRPTGEDVRRWQAGRYASIDAAELALLESLVENVHEPLSGRDIEAIDSAMEDADPLPSLSISTDCPACGATNDFPVDLEGLFMARLARRQREVLVDVHRLASRYGWNEAEVLVIPPWRRQAYLELTTAVAR